MRFIVVREEALMNSRNQIKTSQIWPAIVEADSHDDAVRKVYDGHFGSEQALPMHRNFIVVAMIDAEIVRFEPAQQPINVVRIPYN